MLKFYSPGKLLISAEYFVLNGAKAFALPTRKGQHMSVTPNKESFISWKSYTHENTLWMDVKLDIKNFSCIENSVTAPDLIQKLQEILLSIRTINPNFCSSGSDVVNTLEFDRSWGLGSSSTFINNLSQWADINPYEILSITFGGSGYDVAVAKENSALLYTKNDYSPQIDHLNFNPDFRNELYFIHLNQKQDSQKEVAAYNKKKAPTKEQINQISQISLALTESKTLEDFNNLIALHEDLVGSVLNQIPIKRRLFSDFEGQIKSLGAWGGDFILASGASSPGYFKSKGYEVILSYDEMIFSKE